MEIGACRRSSRTLTPAFDRNSRYFSELRMSALRDTANAEALADQRLQDYEWHLTYLVNNGALTQSEAEDLYQKYAALVWQDTLDIAGGMEPEGLYSSFGSSSYGAVPWARSPMYGPFSRSGFAASLDPFSQTSASVSPWKSRNSFARISGLARSRANSARWSPYLGWSKGAYFRGGGSKGSGRRGGRR